MGFGLTAAACSGSRQTPPPTQPPLADADFAHPWVLVDHVASGSVIDAVTHGAAGYVAIVHPVNTSGGKVDVRADTAAVSPDGVSWSERPIVPDAAYRSIAYGNGRYIAVGGVGSSGGDGLIASSEDGMSWTEVGRAPFPLIRIRYTAGGFMAVGMSGAAAQSSDGVVWTSSSARALQLLDVDFGGHRFVAGGQSIATSSDGVHWSDLACGASLPCSTVTDPSGGQHAVLSLSTVVFGDGRFFATGSTGSLLSADGLTWSSAGPARDERLIFVGGELVEVSGASSGQTAFTVSTSEDGVTFTPRGSASLTRTDATCLTSRCLLLPSAILIVP